MAVHTSNTCKLPLDVTSSTESWLKQSNRWPKKGQVILAHHNEEHIVVYQAFNSEIAKWAVEHQLFGGSHWSPNRMTWIKTNFLWMMYRCDWASKDVNQARVLAITITREAFEKLLCNAWNHSWSPGSGIYQSKEEWLADKPSKKVGVRVQWDPDHDPIGRKEQRRAIQIGIAPDMVEKVWNTSDCIKHIQDITDFVKEQGNKRINGDTYSWMSDETFMLPKEEVYEVKDKTLIERMQITNI